MKNLLQLLQENPNAIKISREGEIKYNACDHPDFMKGIGGKGKAQILYSIYRIDILHNTGWAQNRNALGGYTTEIITLSECIPND